MFCSECGKELNPTAKFCDNCGAKIKLKTENKSSNSSCTEKPEKSNTKCIVCASTLNEDDDMCPYCGYIIRGSIYSNNNERRSSNTTSKNKKKIYSKKYRIILGIAAYIIAVAIVFSVFMIYKNYILKSQMINNPQNVESSSIQKKHKTDSSKVNKQNVNSKNESDSSASQSDQKNNEGKNTVYSMYLFTINILESTFEDAYPNGMTYKSYFLYDVNDDGIYELIIQAGGGESDANMYVYTIDVNSNEIIKISDFSAGHSWLSTKDDELYLNFGYQGYYKVTSLEMKRNSGSWSIYQNLIHEESDLLDYTTYGTALKGYDLSNTSAIEALCPQGLLDDVAYVEGYVKTINGENRLYLSGDFEIVSLQIYSNVDDYKYATEFYNINDIGEYITLAYNGHPASYVIVTPYNDVGAKGESIKCNVESDTLLNLDGTNPNHKGTVSTDGGELFIRSSPEIINSPNNGNKIDCFSNGTTLYINLNYSTDEWYFVTGTGLSGNTVSGYVFKEYVILN